MINNSTKESDYCEDRNISPLVAALRIGERKMYECCEDYKLKMCAFLNCGVVALTKPAC